MIRILDYKDARSLVTRKAQTLGDAERVVAAVPVQEPVTEPIERAACWLPTARNLSAIVSAGTGSFAAAAESEP